VAYQLSNNGGICGHRGNGIVANVINGQWRVFIVQ
jgi:hypothetical protein